MVRGSQLRMTASTCSPASDFGMSESRQFTTGATASGLACDELIDIAYGEPLKRHVPRGEAFGKKGLDDAQIVILHRHSAHTPLVDEVAFIAAFDRCERIRLLRGRHGERDPPARAVGSAIAERSRHRRVVRILVRGSVGTLRCAASRVLRPPSHGVQASD